MTGERMLDGQRTPTDRSMAANVGKTNELDCRGVREVNEATEEPRSQASVLIVDDDPKIRAVTAKNLAVHGFACRTAGVAEEGLALLAENEAEILISDINMPGRDGVWLLHQVSEKHPDTAVIMVTGLAQLDLAVQCLKDGASDFLAKPVRTAHLLTAIERALERRRLILENREYGQGLEARIKAATAELRRAHDDLSAAYRMTLEALSTALDAREAETGSHSRRVTHYTLALADRIGIRREQLDDLARGALLHDVGKIGVPDSILLKPGPLAEEEWAIMRRHPELGYRIIAGIPFLKPAAEIVYSHHERFDGTGYPRGLQGEEIPLDARIFAVADALDAMTSDRPYRSARSIAMALREISSCAGDQFDPRVVEALMALGVDGILELQQQSDEHSIAHNGVTISKRDTRPVRVLVVEDSHTFGRFLLKSLVAIGCEVALTTHEREMTEALDIQAFDLAILDWNLGGVTASGALKRLRRDGVRVVILSGDPDSVGDLGIPVLGKPISMKQLQALIDDAGTRP